MNYFFGIDGGGTKSRIRVVSGNNETLYEALGGSTNIYAGSRSQALKEIRDLILNALIDLQITVDDISGGCISSAGLSRPEEKKLFSELISEELGLQCPMYYCNDGESLLVGGLKKMEGVCLIVGTGSIAIGRLKDGTMARAGGLGHMLGDEGSAYWIAQQAIARSLRSQEKRDLETRILQDLIKFYHLTEPADFIFLLHNQFQKAEIASAAPVVTKYALEHDPLAVDILKSTAKEIFSLVRSVLLQLPVLDSSEIVLAGGVLERDDYILEKVCALIHENYPDLSIIEKRGDATAGACQLAMSLSD
jgi:glucosamine kinase